MQSRKSAADALRRSHTGSGRQRLLDAQLMLSFCCVGLYWISQRTVDAAVEPAGGSSATVSDGVRALWSWGRQLTSRWLHVPTWPASTGGKQGRSSHGSAQHSTRPGFSRMSLAARWFRTLAVARPLLLQILRIAKSIESLRLRLLLPRLSYASSSAALLLGCLKLAPSRQANVVALPASCNACSGLLRVAAVACVAAQMT